MNRNQPWGFISLKQKLEKQTKKNQKPEKVQKGAKKNKPETKKNQ